MPRLDLVMTNLNMNIAFWKGMTLTEEETAKVVFPRDLPTKYIEQAQRNVYGTALDMNALPETDELTKELQRQKVALHSSRAQSWMDDISSVPAPGSPNVDADALAVEFDRQRQGGKPREAHNPMRERSARKGEKFLDHYSILLLRFTPSGRHFYSNDMLRKLAVAVLIAFTQSSSEHSNNMQVAFLLAITVAWLCYILMGMPCCRIWVSRVEALSAVTLVVITAVLFSYTYSTDSEQVDDSSVFSKILYITCAVSFILQCLVLGADKAVLLDLCKCLVVQSTSQSDPEEVSIDLSVVYPKTQDIETDSELTKQANSDSMLVRRISSSGEPAVPVRGEEDMDIIESISNDTPIGSRL